MNLQRSLRRIDDYQQRRRWLALPIAVFKKFGDDQAGNLAALIAYYGFFSMFPLLLVFVSVLGLVLRGDPRLQHSIVHSALRDFPVIGDQIAKNIHSISGSGVALAIGIVGTLWAGLGVTQAAQNSMNQIWDVPKKDWPNFLQTRLRGLLMLAILGSLTVGATFLSGLSTSGGPHALTGVLSVAGSLLLNLALFLVAFRVLTNRDLSNRVVLPGAATAAVIWTALQAVGGYYVTHQLKNASNVYGTFALVIGLLVWLYLGAQITLLCAEVNVVLVNGLWPRSLLQKPPLAEADRRTMSRGAKKEERIKEEEVSVSFEEGPAPPDRATLDETRVSAVDGGGSRASFFRSAAIGAAVAAAAALATMIQRRRGDR
jgi:YihY family inner membrane protein